MRGVYVIAPRIEGPCKIGVAVDVEERINALQTGCWEKLHAAFFGLFWHPRHSKVPAAFALERAAHKALRECELELYGEWFDVTAAEAIAVIKKCAKLGGFREAGVAEATEKSALARSSRDVQEAQRKIVARLLGNNEVASRGAQELLGAADAD